MKHTEPTILLSGLARLTAGLLAATTFCLTAMVAHAHISYSGRDFGSYSGLTNGSLTITNQAVTGNYGWADAADGILGDSHRGRAFRFHLDNPAFVTVKVAANARATTNSIRGLIPAFSLYSGLAAVAPFAPSQTTNAVSPDHDFGAASVAWRIWWVQQNLNPAATDESPTDGSWNALGDWKIGGDGDLPGDFSQLSSFAYRGSVAATGGGNSVTGSFSLPAGDYTVFVGGNDLANKTSNTALSPHGLAATLSVSPTPIASLVPKVFIPRPAGLAANWVLQFAPTVDAAVWTTVNSAPVTVDGQAGVVLDSSADQRYFRFVFVP